MAMPSLPFSPYNATDANNPYLPEDQIAQQYKLADVLRRQPQATSFAGVLANGLGAVGGNLVQGSANTALQNNQALRSHDIQSAASATDVPSLSKALLGSQVPALQDMGLKTKIQQITDDPNKEYRVRAAQAIQQGLRPGTPEFQHYVLTAKFKEEGEGSKFGLNPVYGTDANGNPVVMQLNTAGGITPAKLPDGVSISKTPIKLDAGDHWLLLDPVTRQPVGQIAKNLALAESQKEQGQGQGKAAVNLPIVEANADRMTSQIDHLLNNPGLEKITGSVYGRLPESTNFSGPSKEAQSRLDEVLGGTFLQAYNDLRGGGQISDAEGRSAKAAYSRLQHTEMDTPDYRKALVEFKTEIGKLVNIARARAGQGNVVGASQAAPPPMPASNDTAVAAPKSEQEYNALQPGSRYVDPEGNTRIKP